MNEQSKYLKFLPDVYREDDESVGANFMGRFLNAFERALAGDPDDSGPRGVEDLLGRIQGYFDPTVSPPQFLDWLASWVALELEQSQDWMQADFGETRQAADQLVPLVAERDTRNRRLIQGATNLYRTRGTKAGIEAYLGLYAGDLNVTLNELTELFIVGTTSTVGSGAMIGERPHYFQVKVVVPAPNPAVLAQYKRSVRAIIDSEKPAHTFYDLLIETPRMQISPTGSQVGVNTLLGGIQLG
ncbi:MAG: phage tail protein [Leptospirales bacterium]|jgi:phage tail-like protein